MKCAVNTHNSVFDNKSGRRLRSQPSAGNHIQDVTDRRRDQRRLDQDDDDDRDRPRGGPERQADLAELIRYLAVYLVDRPDEVRVELVEERSANVYELEVAEARRPAVLAPLSGAPS